MANKGMTLKNRFDREPIRSLADGTLTMAEIAARVGCSRGLVEKVIRAENLPRHSRGSRVGEKNHGWRGGISITLYGYVEVKAPRHHPHKNKKGYIFLHRLVMEKKLGRYLLPSEVVDHIDGCTLNNHPDNLRVFASNAQHLAETRKGMPVFPAGNPKSEHKSSFHQRYRQGDLRERQIRLFRERLDKDGLDLLQRVAHNELGIDLEVLLSKPDRLLEATKLVLDRFLSQSK